MNSYERYERTLTGGAIDFLSRTPILMQYAAEYIKSNYAEFAADYRVLVKANVTCIKDFGFDQLSAISDPYRETYGFGANIECIKNGPPISTHPLAASKDLTLLLKPNPLTSTRMLDRIKAIQYYKENFQNIYSILGWIEGPAAEAADLRDVTPFLMDLMEDIPFACELMDQCVETGIEFARAQIEAGADTIGIGDAIASQLSPNIYEQYIQPREKKLIKAIKEMGSFAKLHICGNITHLLPAIADLNVDILDVDHMVDIVNVRKIVGDRVAIAGNIDPVSVVKNGNPKIIREMIQNIYKDVGNPYIVNAGCEIPSGTPVENLQALCEPIPWQYG